MLSANSPSRPTELRESVVAERTAQHEVVRRCLVTREAHRDVAAVPRLENRELVEERDAGIRDAVPSLEM